MITALLGPEQPDLFLRPPDEQDSLGAASGLERRQVLMHHIVFALPPGEVNPRDVLTAREATDLRGEAVGDPGQRGGRGDRQAHLPLHVTQQPARVLQLRDVDVQVHPVDALHLERHMIG